MLERATLKSSGFRVLNPDELEVVSGGGTIVVTGTRWKPSVSYGVPLNAFQTDFSAIMDSITNQLPEAPEDGDRQFLPCELDELIKTNDEKADDLADQIANEINSQNPVDPITGEALEQGALIYIDPRTGQVMNTPISVGTPGNVNVPYPPGISAADVIGFIHSHPQAASSGNPLDDAKFDAADRYPSPGDWDALDGLVAGATGANPDTLSIYIIDQNGDMRKYDYSDKAIYDVSAAQLLGDSGTPPPVPAPEDTTDQCPLM